MLTRGGGTREGSIRVALAAGGCLAFASTFLPWLDGSSGFAMADRLFALAEIGVLAGLPPRWLLGFWYLIPAGAVLIGVTALLAGRRLAALVGTASIVVGAVVCVSVLRAPAVDPLGPLVCLAGLTLAAGSMVALLVVGCRPAATG